MRILLVNAFHYLKGGVERTYLDESRWLTARGHEVAHLAIRDPRNLESPTASHFAPAADYGEGAPAWRQLAGLPRVLWSRPAASAMERLLAEWRPDVAHLHAPSRYLSPSILRSLERASVPTVMTLHDFKPWCTNRILFAHGEPCERCRGGRHWKALATGCVQGSRVKSAVCTVEAYLHQAVGAYRHVRLWIAPSRFVFDKAVDFGVPAAQLRLLHHGVEGAGVDGGGAAEPGAGHDTSALGHAAHALGPGAAPHAVVPPEEPYALYSGRLSVEKGVRLLPEIALSLTRLPILVAGEGPLARELRAIAPALPNLRLLGHLSDADLAALRARAGVVIVPSLFYEHFCYAAAEALLDQRPVVAARIGAIPELVEHEVTGLLARPGDATSLIEATRRALEAPERGGWAAAGRERVRQVADPARHIEGLLAIYDEAMARPRAAA